MRKTGRTKALLAMFLAAASLQAGTAFGAQAAIGSQLQAGTWVKEDAGWESLQEKWQPDGSILQAAGIICSLRQVLWQPACSVLMTVLIILIRHQML